MAVVFTPSGNHSHDSEVLYDLMIDGRAGEYDLTADEFARALRRRRVDSETEVFVEDDNGHRTRLTRRR